MATAINTVYFEFFSDDIHDLYYIFLSDHHHEIRTSVTKNPRYVQSWLSDIQYIHRRRLHHLIIGLDVEWLPNSTNGVENPVSILQLCVGRRCLVFQILRSGGIPNSLSDFLSNPSYTFSGVGIHQDVEKLNRWYGLTVANVVDVGVLAAEVYGDRNLRNEGLKGLAKLVLGKEIEKPRSVTMSDWGKEKLSDDQVQYATVDAFMSFEIGRVLIHRR